MTISEQERPTRVPTAQENIELCMQQYRRRHTPTTHRQLILACQPLARFVARRYQHRQDLLEDLVQVANMGLVKAIDEFDPEKGARFATYAGHKMLGEIRRYLRDKGNHIRIPRRLYELSPRVQAANAQLCNELGREPTVEEITARTGIEENIVVEVLQMGHFIEAPSLDAQMGSESDGSAALGELVGGIDPTLHDLEAYADLRHALTQLNPRERQIIFGRYFEDISQAKLAEDLKISQMHVSRLERKALKNLYDILHEVVKIKPVKREKRAYKRRTVSTSDQFPDSPLLGA